MLSLDEIQRKLKWTVIVNSGIRWVGTKETLDKMLTFVTDKDTCKWYPSPVQVKDLQEFAQAYKKYIEENGFVDVATFYKIFYNTEVEMNNYQELKKKQQAEIDEFPFGAAFNKEQFEEMRQKLPLREGEKYVSLGAGVFVRKNDIPAMEEMFARHKKERSDLIKQNKQAKKNAFDMFVTEMLNHECGYTGRYNEALEALNITQQDFIDNPILKKAYKEARSYVAKLN